MVEVPEEVEKGDLAFPHSRIVSMVREKTQEGQYVRKDVYYGLNILLGNIADEIINEITNTDKAYIEKPDLNQATKKYEKIENILKEKERIIKHLKALEEDVNKLSRNMKQAGEE